MKRNFDRKKPGRITKRVITVDEINYFWIARGSHDSIDIEVKLFNDQKTTKINGQVLRLSIGLHKNGDFIIITPSIIRSIILIGLEHGWKPQEKKEIFTMDGNKTFLSFLYELQNSESTSTWGIKN